MKIEEFYLAEYTADSCLIKVSGKWFHFTAEMLAKYGKEVM